MSGLPRAQANSVMRCDTHHTMKTAFPYYLITTGLLMLCACQALAATNRQAVVFIAGFTDAAGSPASENIEAAVRDLLVSAVTDSSSIQLVDRDRLDLILREKQFSLQGLSDAGKSAHVGTMLGADRMITGSLLVQDEQLTITAHVVDVPTALIQSTCRAAGRLADLLDVVITLATELSAALNIPFDPGVIKEIDIRPVCSLNFLRGIGFFHVGDYDRALMDFMISADLDPDNYDRHYWMARAYMELEEYEHALIELWRFVRAESDPDRRRDAQQLITICRRHFPPKSSIVQE